MKTPYFRLLASVTLVASFLCACGGGDTAAPLVAPGAAAPSAPTVSGTAATGAAIANGSVSMNCVSGPTATTNTAADGSYSLSVSNITFPCVARVVYGAEKLHTYVSATGTANITPVTELLVANLTSGSAADAFDKFDAIRAKTLTATQVTAAIAAVKAYLVTLGVSVTDFPADPIGVKLVAKVGTTTDGDKFDKVLDDLKVKLGTKKLSDAVNDISKTSSTATTGTTTTTTNASGGDNVLTVSDATKSSRNGAYAVIGGRYTNNPPNLTDFGFTGNTKDEKFETDVSLTSAGAIRSATIWYFDANNVISFFGCGGTRAVTCTGVSFDPSSQKVRISNVKWSLVPGFGSAAVFSNETVTVNGTIAIGK